VGPDAGREWHSYIGPVKPTSTKARQPTVLPSAYLTLLVGTALYLVLLAVILGPQVMAEQPLPTPDLRAAGLSSVPELVIPFQVSSEHGGRRITLIGAYADSARTVLFLRVKPDVGVPDNLTVSDGQGIMNAGGHTLSGAPGDYVYAVNSGPRTGADHIANLTAQVFELRPVALITAPTERLKGTWTLTFVLPVHQASPLATESPFQLGAWKVTIEVLEVTPAVVHLQAVIDGANVEEIGQGLDSGISLLDKSGAPVSSVAAEVETTISKEDLNPATGPPNSARVKLQWLRPRSAGTYQLRFRGNGQTHTIAITIPALAQA
jgi:hypothetical protein